MNNTLCFVLMPFGKKPDATGRTIDFDAVYKNLISPAITAAGLEPIRADEESAGGIIHKPMFERLILCGYAVADLTISNANVLYELGIRHAIRPWRTVSIFAEGNRLPFDVTYLRSLPYKLTPDGSLLDAAADRDALLERLKKARNEAAAPTVDSPVFQLVDYWPRLEVSHEKTSLFREQARYTVSTRASLAQARKADSSKLVDEVVAALGPLGELDVAVVIDAMLSFRAVRDWGRMVGFIGEMPVELQNTVMVQEQLGFALNRNGRGEEAEGVLRKLLTTQGPSPETLGILGRVYKDRWQAALAANALEEAGAHLDNAIKTYIHGFESDFRDAYPGVNALTLMEIRSPSDPRFAELLPIVRYATIRKMKAGGANYWDHATLVELAVLERDEYSARAELGNALASVREPFEPETTANNLSLVRRARRNRDETLPWAEEVELKLRARAGLGAMVD